MVNGLEGTLAKLENVFRNGACLEIEFPLSLSGK